MNIVLAVPSSAKQLSGVTRHAANVVRCLLTQTDVNQVHLLLAPWQAEHMASATPSGDKRLKLHCVDIGSSILSRNLWYAKGLPAVARELKPDIVHLAYPAPLLKGAFDCPAVVSLHDLYPYDIPENFGFPKVLMNRMILQQCMRNADGITCVSQSTFERLREWAPKLAEEKSIRIYNCVEPSHEGSMRGPLPSWNGEPFLLCVAQHRRNKNILLALKVFQRLLLRGNVDSATRLVILGIEGPETPRIRRFIETNGLSRRVLLLHGISDEDLQWCYRNCRVLLAPSLIEGFGLPVAEALLAGCSVVCSDIPAFRELDSGLCRFVSFDENEGASVEAFTRAVRDALADDRNQAPAALPQLSAPVIGEEYLHLYRSLCAAHVLRVAYNARPSAATSVRKERAS